MRYPLIKILSTPAMKDSFSRAVIALASLHWLPSRSTDVLTRFLYFSNCSSGSGTLRRHSSTTLSLAFVVDDFNLDCCFRTRSPCLMSFVCQLSSFEGRARLSNMSKAVTFSGGTSQSSSIILMSDMDVLRERWLGLPLGEEVVALAVCAPLLATDSAAEEADDSLVVVLTTSGDNVSAVRTGSDFVLVMEFGSAIPLLARDLLNELEDWIGHTKMSHCLSCANSVSTVLLIRRTSTQHQS